MSRTFHDSPAVLREELKLRRLKAEQEMGARAALWVAVVITL